MKINTNSKIFAVVLAVLLMVIPNIQIFAYSPENYIEDIVVATGSSLAAAKKSLPSGYVMVGDNVNANNNGVVVIGVKKTSDINKAITDIAIMNMNGGYSFEDYANVLKEYKETADEMVETLYCAILEFRENYKANKTPALIAYEMLNRFTDEDYNDQASNKLGDIFVNENTTKEEISVIFMQATSIAVTAIESCLGLGCTSDWVNKFINDSNGEYDLQDDEDARIVFATLERFQTEMKSYENILNTCTLGADASEDDWKAFYESLTEEQQNIVTNYSNTYDYLRVTNYKNGTLLDFFMQDLKEMDNQELYPITHAMTDGQIATLPYSSFCNAFQFSISDEETFGILLNQVKNDTAAQTVSIFEGVDRSIFTADGIALTNEAMRNATSSSDTSWYKGNLSKETENIFYGIIGSVAGIAAISCAVAAFASIKVSGIVTAAYQLAFANMEFISTGIIYGTSNVGVLGAETLSVSNELFTISSLEMSAARADAVAQGAASMWAKVAGAAKIIAAVAIAIVLITLIIFLYKEYKAYNAKKEYTVIPRIIVDQTYLEDNSKKYTYYYAVKDTSGEFADLNNWHGTEWNALYYTKDTSAGKPILASSICQGSNVASDTSYNFAIHGFGEKAAYNLNKFADNKTGIYMFFKTSTQTSTQTGTALSYGNYAIAAAIGLVVGALGMLLITNIKKNNKKEKQD